MDIYSLSVFFFFNKPSSKVCDHSHMVDLQSIIFEWTNSGIQGVKVLAKAKLDSIVEMSFLKH